MRGINKFGKGQQDKKDADKHDAALDALREIKAALSNARSPEEIKLLMAKFVHIADVVPQELVPSDLSMNSMEAVYVDQLAKIADPRQQISEQDLRSGEKSSERAISGIAFLNKELESFLEREDVRAYRKKIAAWANSDMNTQEIQEFKQSREKIKGERSMRIRVMVAAPVEDIERGKTEERRLAEVHGSENHAEVVKCREGNELKVRTLKKQAQEVRELVQKELDILRKKNVLSELGEEYTRNEASRLQDELTQINNVGERLDGARRQKLGDMEMAKKLAERFTNKTQNTANLSPDLTPNHLRTQSRGTSPTK